MVLALSLLACGPQQVTYINNTYVLGEDGGSDAYDETTGAPDETVDAEVLALDAWDDGNLFWFGVTPEQVAQMNEDWSKGGGAFLYEIGGAETTYADPLLVGAGADVASFGKVEVRLLGQSTGTTWEPASLPNLRIDADEFQDGLQIGGQEHLRFNNGQVGGILRESIAIDVFRAVGVPVPKASFAWVGASIWGEDVRVPYTMTEVYKQPFCEENAALLGGGCTNLWETTGDLTGDNINGVSQGCQLETCDDTRLRELSAILDVTPPGPGFEAATAPYVDWHAFQRLQCMSWVLWTGDDYLHNYNNLVVVERPDGMFQLLPYSIDISAGQAWYVNTPLRGNSSLPAGCQADPDCWAELLDTCDSVITDFTATDPVGMVDATYARLQASGMEREPDAAMYTEVRDWYTQRLLDLPGELQKYRDGGFDTGGDTGIIDTAFPL